VVQCGVAEGVADAWGPMGVGCDWTHHSFMGSLDSGTSAVS